jgi:hypothetical protein
LSHFRAHPVFELHDNRVPMSPGQGTPLLGDGPAIFDGAGNFALFG